eukprot:1594531-Rhodomonas_salina.1
MDSAETGIAARLASCEQSQGCCAETDPSTRPASRVAGGHRTAAYFRHTPYSLPSSTGPVPNP